MIETIGKINNQWKKFPRYYWGDFLDVRYYLCHELSQLRGKKILDLACGCGIILNCLNKDNAAYGIDIDPQQIINAKSINPGARIIEGDIFKLPFEEKFFDVIILSHILPKQDYPSDKTPEELIDYISKFLKKTVLFI